MKLNRLVHIIKKTGGLTLNADLSEFKAESGFGVSLMGHEKQVSLSDTKAIQETVKELQNIVQSMSKNTALNVKIGFWLNKNTLFLDVSQIVPDIDTALYLAKAREQIAFYDFNKRESIYV